FDNLDDWYKTLDYDKKKYMREDDKTTGPKGPGYVFTLQGRHFHDEGNRNLRMRTVPYVENTLLHELKQWTVPQFDAIQLAPIGVPIPVRKMGITPPTIVEPQPTKSVIFLKDGPGGGDGEVKRQPLAVPGGPIRNKPAKPPKNPRKDKESDEEGEKIPLTEFVIEFAWSYIPPEKRVAEDPGAKKAE